MYEVIFMTDSNYRSSKFVYIREDEEDEGGEDGQARGIKPSDEFVSMLVGETERMENDRRLLEQQGHKKLAKVNQRERSEKSQSVSNEMDYESNMKQHPLLQNQRFDGIDPNLTPEPPLNSDARREYDNARREQEMEKQLRLGNMPKFKASTPRPPGA
jgi:hypothetical protein